MADIFKTEWVKISVHVRRDRKSLIETLTGQLRPKLPVSHWINLLIDDALPELAARVEIEQARRSARLKALSRPPLGAASGRSGRRFKSI